MASAAGTQTTRVTSAALYTLGVLFLANAFNVADRIMLGVLQEPIKREFALSDFQLGLLGGPAFAILYSIMGIPIARYAEWANRRTIISAALAVFSVMTAMCGIATSYAQLLAARIGVSIGEAGTSPPSVSLVSDYFPSAQRGTAMAVYSLGAPMGTILATMAGAPIAQAFGWEAAFIAFGLVGLLLAGVMALTLHEVEGRAGKTTRTGFIETMRYLATRRTFVHVCVGGAVAGFAATFVLQYLASFLMRVHGFTLSQASMVTGLSIGVFGMIGGLGGGWLSDRLGQRRPPLRPLVCAIALAVAAASYTTSFWMPVVIAIPMLLVASMFMNCYLGISYATTSAVVPANMRATAIAIYTLFANLFGYALGPPILGKISDLSAARALAEKGVDPGACPPGSTESLCVAAAGSGVQLALSIGGLIFFVAAVHYWRASRNIEREQVN